MRRYCDSANSLYTDAAQCCFGAFSISERTHGHRHGNGKIKQFKRMTAFMDLTADILTLAAAAYAAKPGPIVAALGEIKEDIENIRKLS
jgi:hypothetical protein